MRRDLRRALAYALSSGSLREIDLNQLLPFLYEHWLFKAVVGIAAYVGFLGTLKGALPNLSRNELLELYSAVTTLLIIAILIAILVIRIRNGSPRAGEEATRILIIWTVWGLAGIVLFLALLSPSPLPYIRDRLLAIGWSPSITLKVDHEYGLSQSISTGRPLVIRPGETVTLTVELHPLSNLRRDYSFLATSKFGNVMISSLPYEFEYIAPENRSVDYIVIYATDQRTWKRSEQPFNVVIQE
jgi:hypothetical protein